MNTLIVDLFSLLLVFNLVLLSANLTMFITKGGYLHLIAVFFCSASFVAVLTEYM